MAQREKVQKANEKWSLNAAKKENPPCSQTPQSQAAVAPLQSNPLLLNSQPNMTQIDPDKGAPLAGTSPCPSPLASSGAGRGSRVQPLPCSSGSLLSIAQLSDPSFGVVSCFFLVVDFWSSGLIVHHEGHEGFVREELGKWKSENGGTKKPGNQGPP